MKGKVNLLEENECGLSCNCGANIKLGFKQKDYIKFKKWLKENYEITDLTDAKVEVGE